MGMVEKEERSIYLNEEDVEKVKEEIMKKRERKMKEKEMIKKM